MADRREIERLQSEVEELIADLWQVPRFAAANRPHRPQADCYRSDDPPRLTVVVELPGIDPDDVQVTAAKGTLVIAGERRRPPTSDRVLQLEIEYGPFQRQLPVTEDIDTERATASYARGLLTIVLPIAERPVDPVRVPIEVRART